MLAEKLDHIGIKVEGMDAAVEGYSSLGFRVVERRRIRDVALEIAFLELAGQKFELLEALDSTSPISQHPLGLHHLGFRCPDLERAYRTMQSDARYRVLGPPTTGAHGAPVFFVRACESNALLELVGALNDVEDELPVWRW